MVEENDVADFGAEHAPVMASAVLSTGSTLQTFRSGGFSIQNFFHTYWGNIREDSDLRINHPLVKITLLNCESMGYDCSFNENVFNVCRALTRIENFLTHEDLFVANEEIGKLIVCSFLRKYWRCDGQAKILTVTSIEESGALYHISDIFHKFQLDVEEELSCDSVWVEEFLGQSVSQPLKQEQVRWLQITLSKGNATVRIAIEEANHHHY